MVLSFWGYQMTIAIQSHKCSKKKWNKEKICSDIISECMSNSYHEVHIVLITHHELAFGIQIAFV